MPLAGACTDRVVETVGAEIRRNLLLSSAIATRQRTGGQITGGKIVAIVFP